MSKWLKMICVLLCVTLLITCIPMVTFAYDGSLSLNTEIESGKTYYIKNLDDFKTFIKLINQRGQTCEGATFEQTADIVINDGIFSLSKNNEPLYNDEEIIEESGALLCESAMLFKGTFDGNNYSISGFHCNSQGLFDSAENAVFKNIRIKNSFIDARSNSCDNVGIICGEAENTTFENCFVNGIVLSSGANTGGIVGKAVGCNFSMCKNSGAVIGGDYCGGIIGFETESQVDIVDCLNDGTVYSTGNYCGGIVSKLNSSVNIERCANSGEVTANGDYCGGITGYLYLDANKIISSYNTGIITGNKFVGGIAGYLEITGDNHYSEWFEYVDMQYIIDSYYGSGNHTMEWPPSGLVGVIDFDRYSELQRVLYSDPDRMIDCYSAGKIVGADEDSLGMICGTFSGNIWSFNNCYYNRDLEILPDGENFIIHEYYDFYSYSGPEPPELLLIDEGTRVMKAQVFVDDISNKNLFMLDEADENHGYPILESVHDISIHIHSYAFEITTAATCANTGVKTYTCVCGDTYTEVIPIVEHKYVHKTSQAATCTSAGKSHYSCSVCGDSYINYTPAALGHDLHKEIVKSATCVSDGLKVTTCSRCDYYVETVIKSANQHQWTEWEYLIYPTGWTDGLEMRVCTICGDQERAVIPSVLSELQASNGMVSGFEAGSTLEYASSNFNMDESVNISSSSEGSTLGTGSVLTMTYGDGTQEEYEVVIFGDVNGDGWYDGTDSVIVSCLANGMLTKDDVGDAAYEAADCNHDGVIDALDVALLEQAGMLLTNIDQSKPAEELIETSSVYVEYLDLIDQSPEIEIEEDTGIETGTDNSIQPESKELNIIEIIIKLIKSVFEELFSYFIVK